MLFSHQRALPSNYVFKRRGHSLHPLLDANILSVLKLLDHVSQQKKAGNIFTFLLIRTMLTFIYIFEDEGEKPLLLQKGSWEWFVSQHSKGEMSQASDKWKFLQQKQNHCYLKTCIWVILFCSWVQGGYCYNSHLCFVPTSIKSFWGSQTCLRRGSQEGHAILTPGTSYKLVR